MVKGMSIASSICQFSFNRYLNRESFDFFLFFFFERESFVSSILQRRVNGPWFSYHFNYHFNVLKY